MGAPFPRAGGVWIRPPRRADIKSWCLPRHPRGWAPPSLSSEVLELRPSWDQQDEAGIIKFECSGNTLQPFREN